ncbi:hypothetical protein MAJ_03460, partial [Metarhizium majus ARSEF 297]
MESSLSANDPLAFFEENRYFYDEDGTIGSLVNELEQLGIAEDEKGSELAIPRLLQTSARSILEPFLICPDFQLRITLGADPGHRFIFSIEPGQKEYIIVHMWSPGSEAVLYRNSHRDLPTLPPLKAAQASNGLLEPAGAALKKRNYSPMPVTLEQGGM